MVLRTILCPIDFTNLSTCEIDSAVEVATAFGARLVLHYNRMAIGPGLARAWDWKATHDPDSPSETEAEGKMRAALAALPPGVVAEGVISAGPIGGLVLALAERIQADLIVIGSHGWSTQEHESVTERVLAQAPCPVLALHEGQQEPLRLGASEAASPLRAVVPMDFSETARYVLDYAYALARALPLQLELLHVLPGRSRGAPAAEEAARERLVATVPADLATRVTTCVRSGRPATVILSHLREVQPRFTVIGHHAQDLWRRLLTHDTARDVVHEACCPAWIVPAGTHLDVKKGAFTGSG